MERYRDVVSLHDSYIDFALLPNPLDAPVIIRLTANWGESNEVSYDYTVGSGVWPTDHFMEKFIRSFIQNKLMPEGLYQEGMELHCFRVYSEQEFIARGSQYPAMCLDCYRVRKDKITRSYEGP